MFSSGGRRWLLASPLGTGNLTRLLWCITRGVEELACRVAPQGNRHRCEFSRRKPHALPPSQILFLYHSDTSFGTWALLQHRYAADESSRTCRSTDDEFSQPLRALRDPASTEIVALGRKFMMHAMGAIAGIASAGGQHTRLQTQCVSLRTCSLWRKQTSFMLAMCSEVICTN